MNAPERDEETVMTNQLEEDADGGPTSVQLTNPINSASQTHKINRPMAFGIMTVPYMIGWGYSIGSVFNDVIKNQNDFVGLHSWLIIFLPFSVSCLTPLMLLISIHRFSC